MAGTGQPLTHFINALDLEVAAIRKKGGASRIDVRGGERLGTAERQTIYRFPVAEDTRFRDDAPIQIIVSGKEVNGTVVSLREGILLIGLDEDLGTTIPFAVIVTDESFLIERLRVRLEEVRTGIAPFNHASAARVIGEQTIDSREGAADSMVFLGGGKLNREQQDGVNRAFGSNTTFVWGPPGTGKTTVLARIVEAFYRAGKSVLLVSNTNVAVDTALEKVAERLQTDSGFQSGTVIRFGPVVKPELNENYGDRVVLDAIVARLAQDLEQERFDLATQQEHLEAAARPIRIALEEIEQAEDLRVQTGHAKASLASARREHNDLGRQMEAEGSRIEHLHAELSRANTMGSIRRFFARLDPGRLQEELRTAQVKRKALEHALAATVNSIAVQQSTMEASQRKLEDQEARVAHYPGLVDCRAKLKDLADRIATICRRLEAIQQQLQLLRENVIKQCRVMATTVYRTYLKGQIARQFDVVVVDEASMLMLPMTFYAAGLAQESVVIAGDFRQLPPIVTSDEPLTKEWLAKDAFEQAGIPSAVKRGAKVPHLVALRTQYRMHEDICTVVNTLAYQDHPLQTHISVKKRQGRDFPFGRSPLHYVDTTELHPWSALRIGTHSRYNLMHAVLVRNIAVRLHAQGYISGAHHPGDALGVVAPYAAQTRLLQALLQDKLGPEGLKFAATVHSFQGNEKDAMLVDLTDSPGTILGQFMKAKEREDTGARLLNVAISRAREHVVLMANFEYLTSKSPPSGITPLLLQHFRTHGEQLNAEELLALGDETWLDTLGPKTIGQLDFTDGATGVFTEGTFYPAFIQDLTAVKDSLVVFSPFLTQSGCSRWIEYFRAAIARGAAVRVVSRPPGDQGEILDEGATDVIAALRKLGVSVDLHARMHQKIAMIDGKVLWHGSLNILSHRDTSESMLRIPGSAACEQVVRLVSTPLGNKDPSVKWGGTENPICPICGGTTIWKDGRFGIYFECEVACGGSLNARDARRNSPIQRGKSASTRIGQPCLLRDCTGIMKARTGRRGPFLGCSNYPRCPHTENY